MPSQKLSLQQKLLQKLSPQQIQVIKLLEIPTVQLEQRIKKELEENPVLEIPGEESDDISDNNDTVDEESSETDKNDGDEFSVDDYVDSDDTPAYKVSFGNYSGDDKHQEIPFSTGTSFREFLFEQVSLSSLDERQKKLAEYLIGNIDDDGYIRRNLSSISDDMIFHLNMEVKEEELEEVLKVIQSFDPAGVGARSLKECLIIQIRRKKEIKSVLLAIKILEDSFEDFTKKHYDKILRKYDITHEKLKAAIDEILKLNPCPGGSCSNPMIKTNQVIVPDFILEDNDGELELSLNQKNVPELRMSKHYLDMIKIYSKNKKDISKRQKDALVFVKQKVYSAKWFIDAIRQRQETLLKTMTEIIRFQKEYFQEGDEGKLRPMILKDIAIRTDLDISTISRVSNSKYIQTNFGIFPLKYFFSEGMHKDSGEEVSTREIKKILQECIDSEDKQKPMTDDKLVQVLKKKSYSIARRTIAKYREQLGIPVARMRKKL
ncbi:MAG: RNA polymerase factor sigma-54 [Prolixibacteraceae bacterium]|nr:RNA polymerase factor sigma-54 [Prolixibacteraceae bacterium]